MKFNGNWPHHCIEIGHLKTQFQCLEALNKGALAFKIVWGALKWPLNGGSGLIEVAATAGLTVTLCPMGYFSCFFII